MGSPCDLFRSLGFSRSRLAVKKELVHACRTIGDADNVVYGARDVLGKEKGFFAVVGGDRLQRNEKLGSSVQGLRHKGVRVI